jgi:hypothetical protein
MLTPSSTRFCKSGTSARPMAFDGSVQLSPAVLIRIQSVRRWPDLRPHAPSQAIVGRHVQHPTVWRPRDCRQVPKRVDRTSTLGHRLGHVLSACARGRRSQARTRACTTPNGSRWYPPDRPLNGTSSHSLRLRLRPRSGRAGKPRSIRYWARRSDHSKPYSRTSAPRFVPQRRRIRASPCIVPPPVTLPREGE